MPLGPGSRELLSVAGVVDERPSQKCMSCQVLSCHVICQVYNVTPCHVVSYRAVSSLVVSLLVSLRVMFISSRVAFGSISCAPSLTRVVDPCR